MPRPPKTGAGERNTDTTRAAPLRASTVARLAVYLLFAVVLTAIGFVYAGGKLFSVGIAALAVCFILAAPFAIVHLCIQCFSIPQQNTGKEVRSTTCTIDAGEDE